MNTLDWSVPQTQHDLLLAAADAIGGKIEGMGGNIIAAVAHHADAEVIVSVDEDDAEPNRFVVTACVGHDESTDHGIDPQVNGVLITDVADAAQTLLDEFPS
jgi:hypothetical protein